MSKRKNLSEFRCSECGHTQAKWLGRCPGCGQWNTFEEVKNIPASMQASSAGDIVRPVLLEAVDPHDGTRLSTGIEEFDRVLGGGAVKRSALLIGGAPGIGKSTLLLQVAASCGFSTLYVSGEESSGQIRARADRLQIPLKHIELLCTNRLSDVQIAIDAVQPVFLIIDSIQTLFSEDAGAIPGTINQLKYCAHELIDRIKTRDSVLFFSAHITKEGAIAGPKALEHLVDAVIAFERNEDDLRFLRALKNRFGSVDELGIFKMDALGLHAVEDPSTMFITNRSGNLPVGAAIVPVAEGSRVFLVEIQALTVACKGSLPRVFSDKIELARVNRVAAVIEKHIGLRFSDQDIYVNVAGGIRLRESAIDLALAIALYSARTGIIAQADAAFIGELSLAGEIRRVKKLPARLKTANGFGITHVYAPASQEIKESEWQPVVADKLSDVIKKAFTKI